MYRKTRLPNGIRIVTEYIPQVQSVSIGLWVAIGSRDETNAENGIAHFVEHMLFKGTKKRSPLDIAREIDSVGGILNASTSREFTNFYAKVLEKDLGLAMDLLTDIFLNSTFPLREVENEREVIVQEIKMAEDTPDEHVQDLFNQCVFSGHPLGHPILGSYNTVAQISRSQLMRFFRRYFGNPLHLIVAAAGRVNHELVVKEINRRLGRLKPGKEERLLEAPRLSPGINIFSKDLGQVHLCLGTKGLAHTHPSRYAGYILNTILGGSMSSRLFQEVREKRGLTYAIFSSLSSFRDTGVWSVYAGTTRDKLKKVIDLIMCELRGCKEKLLAKEELKKAQDQLKGNILLSWENTDVRMSRLASGEICFGKNIPLKQILNNIERVTIKNVQELSQELFQKKYLSLVALGMVTKDDIAPELLSL